MAKQRYINTKFWDDSYVMKLDPIEKLLFLYFLTNPLTNISGFYEISFRRIAFDTGIDADMVDKILKRFEKDGRMFYREGWVLIKNFVKNQVLNPSVIAGIARELQTIPKNVRENMGTACPRLDTGCGILNLTKLNLTKLNIASNKFDAPNMNNLQKIIDHYLTLTGKDNEEYKKHLRSAKELLTLCDNNPDKAKEVLDKCSLKAVGDWSIYWAVKKWPELSGIK